MTKNEKLVNDAISQWKFNTTIPPFFIHPDATRQGALPGDGTLLAHQKIAPFDDEFRRRSDEVSEAYHEACLAGVAGDKQSQMENFRRVNEHSEPILQDILAKLIELKIDVLFIPGYLRSIYHYRAMARLNLADFPGAIDDATESIRLFWSQASMENDLNSKVMHIMSFMTGARASRSLGFLEQAVTDFRGSCAGIRAIGPGYNRQPSVQGATTELLLTVAMMKHRDQAARPHYTDQERESWECELGIGDDQHGRFHCGNCNATRSDSVKLKVCSRCKKTWFCSKECLAHAWKYKGHKAECKALVQLTDADGAYSFCETNEETIAQTTASLSEMGVALLSGNICLFYDGERCEYFDSLTNDSFKIHRPTCTTVGFIRRKS
jgi:MYND finger